MDVKMVRVRTFSVAVGGLVVGAVLGNFLGAAASRETSSPADETSQQIESARSAQVSSSSDDAALNLQEPLTIDETQPLAAGPVAIDGALAERAAAPKAGADRSQDGAVASFASYAGWLIESPTAVADPEKAIELVGEDLLNPADAQTLTFMTRSPSDAFEASDGAYRVIAYSGEKSHPDQVMVEIIAPLSVGGNRRWSSVGGVVKWVDGGWRLSSIAPREVPQPGRGASADELSSKDRARVLDGLGWRTFKRD